MESYMVEWLNLAIRWAHMITGVAWVGASFYFIWLENNLNRVNPKTGLTGDLWAIHGGGIYHLEKYKLAPEKMPENLHWFKWEAYFTWITGVALLSVVYYLNANIYLVSPDSGLSSGGAIAIGVGAIISGWFIYSFLCDSALGKRPVLLGVILFALLTLAAYLLSQIFTGRGAYIHVGAIMGTIMVGNVFRVIMPAQRNLVAAIEANEQPDPSLPAKGLLRSRHNNYFTLPILFIMISNHFPSTYGNEYNWLILASLAAISILVRHYFNTRHNSQKFAWAVPTAALGMICLAYVTSGNFGVQPASVMAQSSITEQTDIVIIEETIDTTSTANTESQHQEVMSIIKGRCTTCHSESPTFSAFSTAPSGVILDDISQVKLNSTRILAQAVNTNVMPLGNITKMTPEEREILGQWIKDGAVITN
ncbi:urate hydroxylase PuuD [Vibrio sp. SS-MA-C1-2]|uniref:urate hydroxylase PuuD n=1 Tax=Vibrio sp. SS-MA-C1-2 TaxID=2908646 RepID=UPI001F1E2A6D|nr:urate hydroxylase PuuD [Vibrio sp. SS-MA-C1-2]UJF17830.1 urate hydroxylase PuuD [Vibrio sp. SS-MA-C1-2]